MDIEIVSQEVACDSFKTKKISLSIEEKLDLITKIAIELANFYASGAMIDDWSPVVTKGKEGTWLIGNLARKKQKEIEEVLNAD